MLSPIPLSSKHAKQGARPTAQDNINVVAYFLKLNRSSKLPAAMVDAANDRGTYEATGGSDEEP